MRIGIFGGTFDPIHLGHLIIAEQCREQARLDQVRFLPASQPPHKSAPRASFIQRVEMVQYAISGQPAFVVDEIEAERDGPSFTADTLQELRQRFPHDDLELIVGSDSLHDFPRWVRPRQILELAGLLVVARPDWPIVSVENLRVELQLEPSFALRCDVVAIPRVEIASRDLRQRIAEGRSVRYQIPRAVEAYLHDRLLYERKSPGEPGQG